MVTCRPVISPFVFKAQSLLKRGREMNMQTIQIMILLLDSLVKLAPWRVVVEMMERIDDGLRNGRSSLLKVKRNLHA